MDLRSMGIKIRSYTEKDYQYTHDLHRKNMKMYVDKYWGGWDSEIYRRDVCPEITWIIEYEGRKVGFFILHFETKAHLKNIQISPAFQNRGLGSQALEYCEMESINRGFEYLFLEVFLENPARLLYERTGYRTYGKTKSHYLMKKKLIPRSE